MLNYKTALVNYIVKYYNINVLEVHSIIEEEWDYIDEISESENATLESVAKEIIDIYMVA